MIASKVIYQHHFVIVLQQTSPYFRTQEANQVNIHTVRTKNTVSLISVGFTSSCIYVSHGFILYWGTDWTSYMAN